MNIVFSKYHGTGNDFIIINNMRGTFNLTAPMIKHMCHRQLGVGADGLMLINSSVTHDFEMKYYNADGNEGTMCGNGGRSITAFAAKEGLVDREARFIAVDGEHTGIIHERHATDFKVAVSLQNITHIEKHTGYYVIDTGSPHYVEFHDNPDQLDIFARGKEIRWDQRFAPGGLNVNFVKQNGNNLLVRTFERGVENITLSCGTGVTASAAAADLRSKSTSSAYFIQTYGGNLKVSFKKNGDQYLNVWLEGPVKHVFDGVINLP